MVISIAAFIVAFISNLLLIPRIRYICLQKGYIAIPNENRWHQRPTAIFGGIGILVAFLAGVFSGILFNINWVNDHWGLLVGGIIMFCLGLYDDIKPLSAQSKFVFQVITTTLIIACGYSTEFFTPRISDPNVAKILNILLTYVWVVGITNAINLLDNMDGLAGVISFVAAIILSYFFLNSDEFNLLIIASSLAGSILGFLFYNFPPASIFMGDSGSLFIGFLLAVLAISRQPQASNVLAVLGVPTLIFLLPILDLGLVTITRLLTGRSVIQGGRDHTSHRLIAFGFTEQQVIIGLACVALFSGIFAAVVEYINYWFSLIFVPMIIILLTLISAFLGGVKLSSNDDGIRYEKKSTQIIYDLTFRWRFLEIILDLLLIVLAYYLSFFINYSTNIAENRFYLLSYTIPIVIVITYVSFFLFRVYQIKWINFDFADLLRFLKASLSIIFLSSVVLFLIFTVLPNPLVEPFPLMLIIEYSFFLFLACVGARLIFKMLNLYSSHHS